MLSAGCSLSGAGGDGGDVFQAVHPPSFSNVSGNFANRGKKKKRKNTTRTFGSCWTNPVLAENLSSQLLPDTEAAVPAQAGAVRLQSPRGRGAPPSPQPGFLSTQPHLRGYLGVRVPVTTYTPLPRCSSIPGAQPSGLVSAGGMRRLARAFGLACPSNFGSIKNIGSILHFHSALYGAGNSWCWVRLGITRSGCGRRSTPQPCHREV